MIRININTMEKEGIEGLLNDWGKKEYRNIEKEKQKIEINVMLLKIWVNLEKN